MFGLFYILSHRRKKLSLNVKIASGAASVMRSGCLSVIDFFSCKEGHSNANANEIDFSIFSNSFFLNIFDDKIFK